jgi:hypothetical protein
MHAWLRKENQARLTRKVGCVAAVTSAHNVAYAINTKHTCR